MTLFCEENCLIAVCVIHTLNIALIKCIVYKLEKLKHKWKCNINIFICFSSTKIKWSFSTKIIKNLTNKLCHKTLIKTCVQIIKLLEYFDSYYI